jgi:ubiquinone/menaquinone biosynthesis C-methylase UbiE
MQAQSVGQWYSERSGWQRTQGTKLLEMAAPALGERALDIGCGTGELTELIAEAVGSTGQVTGVDLDGERLRVARQRARHENLLYRQEDGESACRRRADAWDLVFANYMIHWMPNKRKFLAEVHRALRPGGRCALATIESLPSLLHAFCQLAGAAGGRLLERLYFVPLEETVGDLRETGFEVQAAVKSAETKQFRSVEEALEFWEATTAGAVCKSSVPAAAMASLQTEPAHCQAMIVEQVVRVVAVKPA